MQPYRPKKIVIGITGASGAVYAQSLLKYLQSIQSQFDTCSVIFSEHAKMVWQQELGENSFSGIPFQTYSNNDFTASFASGTALENLLIICPCSMATLGKIAHGIADNLICRCADVMLKERKQLICVIRETPYNLIHINNMKLVSEAGGIIMPASPSFYHQPQNLDDLINQFVKRLLNLAGFDIEMYHW